MDSTILDATSGNTYRFSTTSSTAVMTCERVAASIDRSGNCSAELPTEAIASIEKTAVLRCPILYFQMEVGNPRGSALERVLLELSSSPIPYIRPRRQRCR